MNKVAADSDITTCMSREAVGMAIAVLNKIVDDTDNQKKEYFPDFIIFLLFRNHYRLLQFFYFIFYDRQTDRRTEPLA